MLRVLIADKLPDAARTALQEAGCEVIVNAALKASALTEALIQVDPDVLVVRGTKVTARDFESAQRLSLVVRAGAGVNTIHLATASSRGVYVANCPGRNATAVAELAFAHILNADRRIADGVADLRAGQWKKKTYAKARGLKGRTLGVIGCGTIGREVIRIGRSFGMRVIAWSRSMTPEQATEWGCTKASHALEVAQVADVVSVHLALNASTLGFVGESIFQAMRPGTIFVNTSRGDVVDEAALADAVRTKGIRAGLDVFVGEPSGDGPWQTHLAGLPGVYGSHHIGASTDQAQEAVADAATEIIIAYAKTGSVLNCVNLEDRTPATHLLVVRHRDEVGVLAAVLELLREANINVEQMENIIFKASEGTDLGRAACARIQVVGKPPLAVLQMVREQDAIFDAKLVPLD
jgi:D-3-phosphoglycerate dehydrogenase